MFGVKLTTTAEPPDMLSPALGRRSPTRSIPLTTTPSAITPRAAPLASTAQDATPVEMLPKRFWKSPVRRAVGWFSGDDGILTAAGLLTETALRVGADRRTPRIHGLMRLATKLCENAG